MQPNNLFDYIFEAITQQELRKAFDYLNSAAASYRSFADWERMQRVQESYDLMRDYWARGYDDEHAADVYYGLVKELYTAAANMKQRLSISKTPFLATMANRSGVASRDWSPTAIRAMLEEFVSDLAMTELEPEPRRSQKRAQLQADHWQAMNDLFDHIVTSTQWDKPLAEPMLELLLSPTADTIDQQLITSAITLCTLDTFDPQKVVLLMRLYSRSTDEAVRQRALVGWTLALWRGHTKAFREVKQELKALLNDPNVADELLELQIQLLYCLSAEADNDTIQRDIMPNLLRHSGLAISPDGIDEQGSQDDDLIHPEAAEQRMEQVEQTMNRMADMQKAGVDIYFGSFAQMKRYPFFSTMSNWFVPFYMEHPAVTQSLTGTDYTEMLANVLRTVPLCDSDKYSFAVTFSQVLNRLPKEVRDMMRHGANLPMGFELMQEHEQATPAYVRRNYLQDLYRFYRFYPQRNELYNPFDRDADGLARCVFFCDDVFASTGLESKFCEAAASLVKRDMDREAATLLGNCPTEARDYNYYMLQARLSLRSDKSANSQPHADALAFYDEALRLRHDDRRALSGKARALFALERYAEAAAVYARLIGMQPDNEGYLLNQCVCLVNENECEKALPTLYKLDYEHQGEPRISRVLARALMGNGELDKAAKLYSTLCAAPDKSHEDMFNYALCRWFAGQRQEAAELFASTYHPTCSKADYSTLLEKFLQDTVESESKLLASRGIGFCEVRFMADLTWNELWKLDVGGILPN